MKIEVELIFKNKKLTDNLIIEFNEDLLKWTIKTENEKELNEILKEKTFSTEKDIINFLNKNKYKFDKSKIKELKKPHIKSFVFNFKEDNVIKGHDGLNSMVIIKLKFKGKNAYVYTSQHDNHYTGFDSYWKMQHEGHDAKIWDEIFNLDKQGYICFNDLYDKIESEYSGNCEDFYNSQEDEDVEYEYENIVDYAKEVLNEGGFLIVDFCDRYISLLNDFENERRYNPNFEINCISEFYIKYPKFYDKEINISKDNWETLERVLGKTESIGKYKYDLLNSKYKAKEVKEKRTKI